MRLWMLKTPSAFQFVELAAFRLLASSDHGQPYNNVAQILSNRRSKSSGDAGRDHRAPSSTDRAASRKDLERRNGMNLPSRRSPHIRPRGFCILRLVLVILIKEHPSCKLDF